MLFGNAKWMMGRNGKDELVEVTLAPTGISIGSSANLTVFPNPFSDYISIANGEKINRVVITTLQGQQIMELPINGERVVSTRNLPNGIFLFYFTTSSGERIVKKLMKQ